MSIELIHGDCLEVMPELTRVDLVLVDPPYGSTACKWDIKFNDELWGFLWGFTETVISFGSEPFSTELRKSQLSKYKYDWYWNKKFGGNFVQAKRMPLKTVENIMVFHNAKTLPPYYPIMVKREKPITQGGTKKMEAIPVKHKHEKKVYDKKYPTTDLFFPKELGKTVHPTQKPVPLLEYLIKTYTTENQTVLDFCMGSGSTGVACQNTGRNFIGIEKEKKYYEIACERMAFKG